MRLQLLILISLIVLLSGCNNNPHSNVGSSVGVRNNPLPIVDSPTIDNHSPQKLIVLKRVEMDNQHEKHKEIVDENSVSKIQNILNTGVWEKVKLSVSRPPDYRLYFQPTAGREEVKATLYDVWFTNGFAEIYLSGLNLYQKLSIDDSETLLTIIQ